MFFRRSTLLPQVTGGVLCLLECPPVLYLSRGEIILVAFVFALVYGALVLPRLAERWGKRFAGGSRKE